MQRPDAPHERHRRTLDRRMPPRARARHSPRGPGQGRPPLRAQDTRPPLPIPVDLQVRAKERLPEPVGVSAYYVVAEALTNAASHAHASAVGVEAEIVGDLLRVTVRDDGVGGREQWPGRPEGPRGGTRRPDRPSHPPGRVPACARSSLLPPRMTAQVHLHRQPRSRHSPAAARSPSTCRSMPKSGCRSRSRSAPITSWLRR